MSKLRRLTALLLCGLLLTTSCSKDPADPGSSVPNEENTETFEKTEVLTNVFRGTGVTLPEEYFINTRVQPYYDTETGEMRIYCTHWYESDVMNEDGYYDYLCDHILLTISTDGTILNEQKLSLGDNVYVNSGVLTKDKFYFLYNTYDQASGKDTYRAAFHDFTDGTNHVSDDVSGMFTPTADRWFYIDQLAIDGDGMIYLAAEQEIVVLDSTFAKQFSVTSQNWINDMVTAADGTVYVTGYFDNGYGFVPVDKTAKALGKTSELPSNLSANQYLFGDGYDIFLSTDDGLYGYNFASADSTEPAEPVLLFSYPNSDLFGNSIEISKIVSADCVIGYEQDPETYDYRPVIYNRSADIDLSQVKVLEIAYTNSQWDLSSGIVQFNKANDGVRIVTRDYSQYNTDEDYTAGTKKLVNDILNGIYKPDMVTGYSASDDLLAQIYANNLYTDLYPLMEADGTIAKDDLLGCITRTYETGDGKLWALGKSLTVQTLMGTKEMLGDRTGWTLSEMIDFANTLPDGTQLLLGLSQQTASSTLLGQNGYGMFIDMETNTCNFESEEFIKYLEYLATLPATYEEAIAATGWNQDDYDSRYLLYHNGQVALKNESYYGVNDWVGTDAEFNTPDVVRIGYPTADGTSSGARVDMTPYVITSFCEYPDEAWDFIESLIIPTESSRYSGRNDFPVLKSEFMKTCEEEYDSLFEVYFSGGMSWGPYNPEYDDLEAEMQEPGIRKFFTEEDAKAMLAWFDNEVGAPTSDAVNEEITAIIEEEISSYLGGAKTASDCARIIQSRVNIWLAEHE